MAFTIEVYPYQGSSLRSVFSSIMHAIIYMICFYGCYMNCQPIVKRGIITLWYFNFHVKIHFWNQEMIRKYVGGDFKYDQRQNHSALKAWKTYSITISHHQPKKKKDPM